MSSGFFDFTYPVVYPFFMFPLLFEIPIFGGLRVYTYGVFMAATFVSGILWSLHESRLQTNLGINRERILDLSFYLVLVSLVGARLFYIGIEWDRYLAQPLDVLKIWQGGLVYYGGLLAAIGFSFFYLRKIGVPFLQMADVIAPGIALGYAFARMGCFSAGCCYGRVAPLGSLLAVVFPEHPYTLAPHGVPLYATQLMALGATLTTFALLIWIRRHKRFTGQVFASYLVFYGIARTILEAFRASDVRGDLIAGLLTRAQWISLLLVLFGLILYGRLWRKTA